jgi:hypothetical protein
MDIKKSMSRGLALLNSSPLLAGLAMLMLNIGSKYVEIGLTKTQEQALRNGIARELLIFAMVFMGTKDIILSVIMTASFIILSDYIFNENSSFCVIPRYLRRISMEIDLNGDSVISKEEEEKALTILKRAKEQKNKSQQALFTSYLPSQQFASI